MRKPDPVELALDALSQMRAAPDEAALAKYLSHRSNLVVAKAAKLAGDAGLSGLGAELVTAFHRLMANPVKLDKGCAAITATVRALYMLDHHDAAVYRAGARHVQMEGSFGPPVDVAAELRGHSAQGLALTHDPAAPREIVRQLVDPQTAARAGAVRACAALPGEAGELLLRLKVLTGDSEPEIIGECFTALLAGAFEASLGFVAGYLDSGDPEIAAAAAVALGTCRRPQAVAPLVTRWQRGAHGELREAILLALAAARDDSAVAFLIGLLESERGETGCAIIHALAPYKGDDRVRGQIAMAVEHGGDKRLAEAFRSAF